MKIQLTIQCTDDEFTDCISGAYEKAYQVPLPTIQIVPFTVGSFVSPDDVKNMTKGSCLAELRNDKAIMKIVG